MSNPDTDLKSLIIDLYQAGQSLKEIVRVTGARYSLVYRYTAGNDPSTLKFTVAIPASISEPICSTCPMLAHCRDERLWLDTLPCEAQLDFEVGTEYDGDSSPTLWVMPLQVRVNVEAMG